MASRAWRSFCCCWSSSSTFLLWPVSTSSRIIPVQLARTWSTKTSSRRQDWENPGQGERIWVWNREASLKYSNTKSIVYCKKNGIEHSKERQRESKGIVSGIHSNFEDRAATRFAVDFANSHAPSSTIFKWQYIPVVKSWFLCLNYLFWKMRVRV